MTALSMMKDEGWSKGWLVALVSKFEKRCAQFSSHFHMPKFKVETK